MLSNLKQIVLADDDEDDIEMFQDAVDEVCPTLEVVTAKDGVELLSLLDDMPKPDAIVLDINMPLKSGTECLVELRAQDDFDIVPISMLSTSSSKKEIDYCMKKGADNYFVKPHTYAEMKSIVEDICYDTLTSRN